jgi:hypothetical protein
MIKNKICSACKNVFSWEGHKTNSTHCSEKCKKDSLKKAQIKYKETMTEEKRARKKAYDYQYNNNPERKAYMKEYRTNPGFREKENAAGRKWYRKNSEVEHNGHLKRTFGITREDFNQMMGSQNGVCDICKNPESRKNPTTGKIKHLCVDHCHTTGKVRGLLCFACNSSLGKFKDSIPTLENAITYLKKHGK